MDFLDEAVELLKPFMAEDRRDTWLTLAFHRYRELYDTIPQGGAPADFVVRCARILLDHGCRGERHALSLLLEVVSEEAGNDQQASFQALIEALDRQCGASASTSRAHIPEALAGLRETLRAGRDAPVLDQTTLQEIRRHSPRTLDEYQLGRVAEWSQPRYALDKRFTQLTVLVDQGPDAQSTRWQPQPRGFQDLREVLAQVTEPAMVVLGPPGCGKSTLLRRLELDLAVDALRSSDSNAPLSVLLSLNRYRPGHPGDPLPSPQEWLELEWAHRFPAMARLDKLLQSERLVLLLDAVNEMPHGGEEDYRQRIALWRDFLADLALSAPGTRAIFSCRGLDYSASLSTPDLPVPHVRIQRMSDTHVEDFLSLYSPEHGTTIWHQLKGTPQLDLFRSPFYLKLLLAQSQPDGTVLRGRAALFTGFVRQALARETDNNNPLFWPGALLDRRDHDRTVRREWRDASDLPSHGVLFPALSALAFGLQERCKAGNVSQVRADYDEARAILGNDRAEDLLHAGVDLQLLEVQWDDVFFVHQLLQEYFAARAVVAAPRPELARAAWRAAEMSPTLKEQLHRLADSDPLPAAPATGWEETFVLAAAMMPQPDAFVDALAELNLPLAGRCAAQPDITIAPELRTRLQHALVSRSRDPAADLRARIAAARALGDLGDPRFERRRGPDGEYLLPPLIHIDGDTYPIGSDEGLYEDEAPAHRVALAAFAIGKFPVTNAEWRHFLEAGGYDDERWWQTDAARAWRRGEGTAEGPRQEWREWRQRILANPGQIQELLQTARITSKQAKESEELRDLPNDAFEARLEQWYPPGRQTQPALWDDPAFNHPSQPVVGICWYEAQAYCAWLSAQSAVRFRLPTEVEWEAAARGQVGRRYPWTGEFDPARGNVFETHVRRTTPAGVFPCGDTLQGLADMSGNVWEWTASRYRPYPYDAHDGREDPEISSDRPVLRGSSWHDDRVDARCASRDYFYPDFRLNRIGFRLVRVPLIV